LHGRTGVADRELDQHLACSTVLESVTHCFLRDAVKLS
jgi:hypothetical protein